MNVNVVKKCIDFDYEKIKSIASQLNIHEKLVELLYSRGLSDVDDVKRYLYPDIQNLYDPYLMKGMAEAVERIRQAINNKEKVVIYGDYDADGVCSAAILALYLSSCGLDVYSHIPNRIGEGYGLNVDSLAQIIDNVLPDLIITCDCGISGYDEVEFAMDLGVDVIVTDHHEVGERIPSCIVVNPKQGDCNYPYNMLCGAGVALKVVQALGGREAMENFLDLAAVATIADLVPLLDENRLIVQLGLERLKKAKNLGLREMFADLNVNSITSSEIAYKIAPRINAAGRMGDAYRAFVLLTSSSLSEIRQIIAEINEDNTRRKQLCDEMYLEAVCDLAYEDMVSTRAIVLSHPSWEKGITGIVAARLTNDYNRPTFIMVNSGEDTYKGTCRSIDGINVYELLTACSDLLIEFGGHSQAAGYSIKEGNIPSFRQRVNEYLSRFDDQLYLTTVKYDLDINENEINNELVDAFEMVEPVGNSNTKPLLKLVASNLSVAPCKNNSNHISITTGGGFQIFAFSYSKQSYKLLGGGDKDLVIELQTSMYGTKQPKGILRACKQSDLYINETYLGGYPFELLGYFAKSVARYTKIEYSMLRDFTKDIFGTLVIASSVAEYKRFLQVVKFAYNEFMYSSNKNNYSKIIVAPNLEDKSLSLPLYKRIVFLSKPISEGVISYLNTKTNAEIFVVDEENITDKISLDRKVFAKYYDAVKKVNNLEMSNILAVYRRICSTMSDINLPQLVVCINIFEELGILNVSKEPYKISIVPGVKVDLESSRIYKCLNSYVS